MKFQFTLTRPWLPAAEGELGLYRCRVCNVVHNRAAALVLHPDRLGQPKPAVELSDRPVDVTSALRISPAPETSNRTGPGMPQEASGRGSPNP